MYNRVGLVCTVNVYIFATLGDEQFSGTRYLQMKLVEPHKTTGRKEKMKGDQVTGNLLIFKFYLFRPLLFRTVSTDIRSSMGFNIKY